MQRTNSRAALLFVGITLGAITLICGGLWLADVTIPEWFTIVGRWLPALVSLLVLRRTGLTGGVVRWWSLNPGGWRRLLAGAGAAMGVLFAVYALSAQLVRPFGVAPQGLGFVLQAALIAIPYALLFSLSTLGEEVGWRGFLQNLLAERGFWTRASLVAGVWVLFHLPLHGVMVAQGTLPPLAALLSTLGLFPLGLLLSALVARFGSVWPAVLGHALPMATLNFVVNPGALAAGGQVAVAVTTAVLTAAAALAFAPRGARTA